MCEGAQQQNEVHAVQFIGHQNARPDQDAYSEAHQILLSSLNKKLKEQRCSYTRNLLITNPVVRRIILPISVPPNSSKAALRMTYTLEMLIVVLYSRRIIWHELEALRMVNSFRSLLDRVAQQYELPKSHGDTLKLRNILRDCYSRMEEQLNYHSFRAVILKLQHDQKVYKRHVTLNLIEIVFGVADLQSQDRDKFLVYYGAWAFSGGVNSNLFPVRKFIDLLNEYARVIVVPELNFSSLCYECVRSGFERRVNRDRDEPVGQKKLTHITTMRMNRDLSALYLILQDPFKDTLMVKSPKRQY
ncbi:hypothetical protein MP228_000213 [Amoeboaphelidium protococcarum]|nr:hypothetical protein MP228_000213 [Amoeboaphelidium protococcarum]